MPVSHWHEVRQDRTLSHSITPLYLLLTYEDVKGKPYVEKIGWSGWVTEGHGNRFKVLRLIQYLPR